MFGRSALMVFVSLTLLVAHSASAEIIAQWRLDGDVTDHIGNNDGTLFDGAEFVADAIRGTVLSVDGVGAHCRDSSLGRNRVHRRHDFIAHRMGPPRITSSN